jgi:hypothetical protein
MAGGKQSREATSDVEPELGTYLKNRADVRHKGVQPVGGRKMPGLGMSAEDQMPTREMNEPPARVATVKGEMPRPGMTG